MARKEETKEEKNKCYYNNNNNYNNNNSWWLRVMVCRVFESNNIYIYIMGCGGGIVVK